MKAVVKYKDGKNGWEIRDIEKEKPYDLDVEIKVEYIGICGSELHLYHDNHYYKPPAFIGHEFAGVISAVGKDVKDWKIGDRVVTENHITACRKCSYCRSEAMQLCPERKPIGYVDNKHYTGAWTEYVNRPEWLLHRIPDKVTLEEAALTEPITIGVHSLCDKVNVTPNDVVLIQGCGTIGLLAGMVAKALGAYKVIITGTEGDEKNRLAVARKIGFDSVININKEVLEDKIKSLTNGAGVDIVVEASGSEMAINSAIELTKKKGTILAIGEAPKSLISVAWNKAVFKAISILFSFGSYYNSWEIALKLLETKKIDVNPLISHKLPLAKWEEGFRLLEAREGLKVLLKP